MNNMTKGLGALVLAAGMATTALTARAQEKTTDLCKPMFSMGTIKKYEESRARINGFEVIYCAADVSTPKSTLLKKQTPCLKQCENSNQYEEIIGLTDLETHEYIFIKKESSYNSVKSVTRVELQRYDGKVLTFNNAEPRHVKVIELAEDLFNRYDHLLKMQLEIEASNKKYESIYEGIDAILQFMR